MKLYALTACTIILIAFVLTLLSNKITKINCPETNSKACLYHADGRLALCNTETLLCREYGNNPDYYIIKE